MGETFPKGQQMSDFERTRMNLATAAIDNNPPVASRNPAVAMIDEGNALEEQGRIC